VVLHMWHFVAGFPQGYVTKAFFWIEVKPFIWWAFGVYPSIYMYTKKHPSPSPQLRKVSIRSPLLPALSAPILLTSAHVRRGSYYVCVIERSLHFYLDFLRIGTWNIDTLTFLSSSCVGYIMLRRS
jgi:hypothetical protein